MKTKLSKKLISLLLAVMMIVTSVPIVSVFAFAAEDSAVKEVKAAMGRFEQLLQSEGAFTNVLPAYNAYVDCQKALDAYIYGGEADALNNKATALDTARGQIGTFTGYQGTAVPSFVATTDPDHGATQAAMQATKPKEYWNNILYTKDVTGAVTGNFGTANVDGYVYYSSETTLLYDGVNSTMMPVMLSGYVTAKKTRYIYGCYPCDASGNDVAGMALKDYWKHSAGTGTLDFDYALDNVGGTNYGSSGGAGYNAATGKMGNQAVVYRSGQLTYNTSWSTYKSGNIQYGVNGLGFSKPAYKTVNGVQLPYNTYTPSWYYGSGESQNSNTGSNGTTSNDNKIATTSAPINVIDYTYLTEGLAEAGNRMKAISPSNYSEGGLTNYINAMEAAATFNPNSYFTSTNRAEDCARDMKTVTDTAKTVAVTENSQIYKNFRNAMTEPIRDTYAAGNTIYTEASWNAFVTAYNAIKNIMAECNDTGYTYSSVAGADALIAELQACAAQYNEATGKGLKTLVEKVDTDVLVAAIDNFNLYKAMGYFSAESIAAVQAIVDNAVATVWQGGTMIDANVKDKVGNNQQEADDFATQITNSISMLRISPEAPAVLASGILSSLNYALSLTSKIDNPDNYTGYAVFEDAIHAGQNYLTTLANTPLTNLDSQLAEYTAVVQAIHTAYDALARSFVLLEDGTIAFTGNQNAITTLEKHENSNKYNWWIDFDYPSSAIVIKTTHNPTTVTYGKANLTYRINIDNNISKENNSIDSITINGTADRNNQITGNNGTSTPPGLNDSQKATYAGCLAVDGFSLTNFRVGHTTNDEYGFFGRTAGGDKIYDKYPANDEFTTILATTEGYEDAPPARGCINLKPGAKGDAEISLAADMNVDLPGTDANVAPSASTVPTLNTINFTNHYFGVTGIWNTQPTLAYAGYYYLTSKENNQYLSSSVTVIDISYLFDLIRLCKTYSDKGYMYKEDKWATFKNALKDAEANLQYANIAAGSNGATTLLNRVKTRYNTLWAAYDDLMKNGLKEFNITFNYKTNTGADTSTTFTAKYGQTLSEFATTVEGIHPSAYDTADQSATYTFSHWDVTPQNDYSTAITADKVYTAVYTMTENFAQWAAYNTARAQLLGALEVGQKLYTVDDLLALKAQVEGLTFINYTEEQKAATYKNRQTDITTEAGTLDTLKNNLRPAGLSLEAAEALVGEQEAAAADNDRFDFPKFAYTQMVTICGVEVEGLIYKNMEELNPAIQASIEQMTVKNYTVSLNGNQIIDSVPYGSIVAVFSDGSYIVNPTEAQMNAYEGDVVGWTYSYDAPSRGTSGPTAPKYVSSAPAYSFIVKGDTFLTATIADTETTTYVVTVQSSTGRIIDMQSTTGQYTMPSVPAYYGYLFTGFNNGAEPGQVVTVSADVTIIANYDAQSASKYTIYTAASWDDALEGEVTSGSYDYNEKVTFTAPDAYCWVIADLHYDLVGKVYDSTYTLLAFGSSYSFYACESYIITTATAKTVIGKAILPLTKDDYDSIVKDATNVTGNSVDGYVTSFDDEAEDRLYDGQGNGIYAVSATGTKNRDKVVGDAVATVTSLDAPLNKTTKFALIGTFTLPEGAEIVECGFLFAPLSSDPDAPEVTDMTVEKVGQNGIVRMKSTKYTVGNQFVINVSNPATAVTFKYVPYAIVKTGNTVDTVYGTIYTGTNQF